MANFTKKAIKDTFISLLKEKPFNQITVKDIVERCGENENTYICKNPVSLQIISI